MTEPVLGVHVGATRGKRLKVRQERRTCMAFDCDTFLSMYNHGDFCYGHEPKKYIDPTRGEPRKRRSVGAS